MNYLRNMFPSFKGFFLIFVSHLKNVKGNLDFKGMFKELMYLSHPTRIRTKLRAIVLH